MVSYLVANVDTGIVQHGPMVRTGRSKFEVEGSILSELQTTYPATEGWANHSVNAIELPTAALVVILAKVTTS